MNAVLLLLLVASQKTDKPDLVQGMIETKGDVWVGQRVTVVVKLYSPTFFAGAAAFDLPSVPGVVILPPQGSPTIGSEAVGDDTYTTQRHELAVYAQRAGAVRLPPIRVRFASDGGIGKPPVPRRGATRELTFTAKMPPGAEGLATVITTPQLSVKESWKPEPGEAKLGGAFTRTVTVRARDVPGMVLPAMPWEAPEGIAIYPAPPAVTDASDRGESTGQRLESVTYVCEKPGTFTLPALTLTWWDLAEKKLRRVRLPSRSFEVAPGPAPAEDAAGAAADTRGRRRAWLVMIPASLVALVAALWLSRRRLSSWWGRTRLALSASEPGCFVRFGRACQGGDAREIYDTLTAWLDRAGGGPRLDDFAARSGDVELAAQIGRLESHLFGRPDGEAHPLGFSAADLWRHVNRARGQLLGARRATPSPGRGLAPLNPP
jgi:hypothetical protein